jgi:hypothetical protein
MSYMYLLVLLGGRTYVSLLYTIVYLIESSTNQVIYTCWKAKEWIGLLWNAVIYHMNISFMEICLATVVFYNQDTIIMKDLHIFHDNLWVFLSMIIWKINLNIFWFILITRYCQEFLTSLLVSLSILRLLEEVV